MRVFRASTDALYAAVAVALLGLILFTFGIVYTFRQQDLVDKRLCEQTVANRMAIRSTWDAARILILQGQTDPEAAGPTNDFFDAVLKPIPELVCVDNQPVPTKP